MKPDFTTEELLESILRESNDLGPADAWTMEELYQKCDLGRDKLRRKLHELKKAGQMEPCRVMRENLGGDMQSIRAYRFKKGGDDEVA